MTEPRLHLLLPTMMTLALLVGLFHAVAEQERIGVRISGYAATAPADAWMVITVDPQPEDRLLIVEVIGEPGEYRRSDRAVPGEHGPRIRQEWFRHLAVGCYYFVASIADHAKVLARAQAGPLSVIGLDGDPCPSPF